MKTNHGQIIKGLLLSLMFAVLAASYANAQVTVYQHANYGGSSQTFGEGQFNPSYFSRIREDEISSLRIESGWRATLCESAGEGNGKGRCRSYTRNATYVGDELQDKTSFIRVERNVVTLFEDADFLGAPRTFPLGTHTINAEDSDEPFFGVSSIKVPFGMVVTFRNSERVEKHFTEGDAYIGDEFNDNVETITVKEAVDFTITQLRVTLSTQKDDNSRGGSVNDALIGLRNRIAPERVTITTADLASPSVHESLVNLPEGTTLGDITSFSIHHYCACDGFNWDNWNLEGLKVEVPGFNTPLLQKWEAGGGVLFRFTMHNQQLNESVSIAAAVKRRLPLYAWYNPALGDNFLTASRQWSGKVGRVQSGYRLSRVEGFIDGPETEATSAQAPLYTWYNSARGDFLTTTEPYWVGYPGAVREGYTFIRLEGYVDRNSGSDKASLSRMWNASRADNYTSTSGVPGGYVFYRTEGFIGVHR